jgi:hypothetical protein
MTAVLTGGIPIWTRSTAKPFIPSPAPAVGNLSRPTGIATGNTAPTTATSWTASKVVIAMTEEQFEREKLYQASMNLFKSMLEKGLITEEQYAIIDTKMLEKYRPLLGTLFAEIT